MENDQAAYLSGEVKFSKEKPEEIADDFVWKALYSHSFTLLYSCENCDHEFDIDGWFYKFETITCPKCKTNYSGVFGKILNRSKDKLIIETFEGQEIAIQIPSGSRAISETNEHIILVVFAKSPEKQNIPWGIIDYCEKKPQFKLLRPGKESIKNDQQKKNNGKPKSILAYLLFGVLSILGIFGFVFVAFPGLYHF